jgi:uncharacterized membrane protein (UPF0127 family)
MEITKVIMADDFKKRIKGLIGKKELSDQEGLLLCGCKQIHTMFMKYPINAYFMNKVYEVIAIEKNIQPWSKSEYYKDSYFVLETNISDYDYCIGKSVCLLK